MKKVTYKIKEECVACGSCKKICPRQCISKGRPYYIHTEKCIGCGLCTQRCWRGLIVRE